MTDSLGMVQVRGLASALVAADTAVTTADVSIAGFGYLHDGQVTVSLRGSRDSVQAAVDAVRGGSGPAVIAASVIGRVAAPVEQVLRERSVPVGGRAGAPAVRGRGGGHRPARPGRRARGSPPAGSGATGPERTADAG